MNPRSTINDVALAAGVSRATVSRVMNGLTTVDPELAARVRAVAAQLDYSPSTAARSLSMGRTQTVAVMLPELGNQMFQRVFYGFRAAAAAAGYRVLIAETTGTDDDETAVAVDARRRCDALLMVGPRSSDEALAELLTHVQPAVVVGRRPTEASGITNVPIDYAAGILAAVDHLCELGHRDLVYLEGPPSSSGHRGRLDGLARATAERPYLRLLRVPTGSSIADGYAMAERVLATEASAVLAFNDLVAFGLLARLDEIGVRVPRDLSVIGFDDVELAQFAATPITTLRAPHADLGAQAWARIHALLQHRAWAEASEPVRPELVVRASTGPVPPLKGRVAWRPPPRRAVGRPAWTIPDAVGAAASSTGGPMVSPSAAVLGVGDRELARYETGAAMPGVHSPRPYVHPLRSLAGWEMTNAGRGGRRHWYGLSLALPEVNGTSFWGGRTFVRELGPTMLANHGVQRVLSREVVDEPAVLVEALEWIDEHGGVLLTERRTLAAHVDAEAARWALRWHSELTARTELTISSPASSGLQDAGYGGIFGRLGSSALTDCLSPGGVGVGSIHGATTDWAAFVSRTSARPTTLVAVRDPGDPSPWFCRNGAETGIGPAIAWDTPRIVDAGETLTLACTWVIVDDILDAAAIDAAVTRARSALA